MAWLLLVSGLLHLCALWLTAAPWEGPVSFRKPGLFGVSAGLTIFSLMWVILHLRPQRFDRWILNGMAALLGLEVLLITIQFWRGVPSHFNRDTVWDTTVEAVMLGLIALVTLGIGWLSIRAMRLPSIAKAEAIALRWGLWGLLVSCLLGLVSTVAGDMNLFYARAPEKWGQAGVLKFPHGAVLHAIQTLPLLAVVLRWLQVAPAVLLVRSAVIAHILFLVFAIRQTVLGRDRFDCDSWAAILLVGASVAMLLPIGYCLVGLGHWLRARYFRSDQSVQ